MEPRNRVYHKTGVDGSQKIYSYKKFRKQVEFLFADKDELQKFECDINKAKQLVSSSDLSTPNLFKKLVTLYVNSSNSTISRGEEIKFEGGLSHNQKDHDNKTNISESAKEDDIELVTNKNSLFSYPKAASDSYCPKLYVGEQRQLTNLTKSVEDHAKHCDQSLQITDQDLGAHFRRLV